jgi:hypothetical protein
MVKKVMRYLKGPANVGLLFPNKEGVKKAYEKGEGSWPEECCMKDVTTVWTDSSFAPNGEKSQGGLVVTMAMAPVFWKCGFQTMVSTSTAECELMKMMEGNLASMSVGEIIHEVCHPNLEEEEKDQKMSFKEYIKVQEEYEVQKT